MYVANRAQIPAGYGQYKDRPTYPNFGGEAHILIEGIEVWLNNVRNEAGIVKITLLDTGEEVVKERDFWFAWYEPQQV